MDRPRKLALLGKLVLFGRSSSQPWVSKSMHPCTYFRTVWFHSSLVGRPGRPLGKRVATGSLANFSFVSKGESRYVRTEDVSAMKKDGPNSVECLEAG